MWRPLPRAIASEAETPRARSLPSRNLSRLVTRSHLRACSTVSTFGLKQDPVTRALVPGWRGVRVAPRLARRQNCGYLGQVWDCRNSTFHLLFTRLKARFSQPSQLDLSWIEVFLRCARASWSLKAAASANLSLQPTAKQTCIREARRACSAARAA